MRALGFPTSNDAATLKNIGIKAEVPSGSGQCSSGPRTGKSVIITHYSLQYNKNNHKSNNNHNKMAVNFVFLATVASCVLFAFAYGQLAPITLDKTCLGCICEASSGCNLTLNCEGSVCGPFRMTWAYWSDGGKPTLNGEPNTDARAYSDCANHPYCAARAVEGYMNKFAQDCNGDAIIDCKDFARIHRLGAYGCGGGLEPRYENAFNQCVATYA